MIQRELASLPSDTPISTKGIYELSEDIKRNISPSGSIANALVAMQCFLVKRQGGANGVPNQNIYTRISEPNQETCKGCVFNITRVVHGRQPCAMLEGISEE